MQSLLTPGVRDALAIVRHRKYKVATVAALSMLMASFFAVSIPSSYVASSSLLVKFGREYVYRPEVGAPPAVPSATRTNEIVNGEIQILRARDLKEQVVDILGAEELIPQQKGWLLAALSDLRDRLNIAALERSYAWIEARIISFEGAIAPGDPAKLRPATAADEAVLLLERDFKVQGIKDSPVIELSYSHENPALARRVLQELIGAFTEKRLRIYSEPQLSFLQHQIGELHGNLTDAEAALQAFKAGHDIYNIDEQMRLLLVRESEFENRIKEDASRLGEIERRMSAVDQQLREMPKTVVLNAESDTRQVRNAEQMLLDMTLKEQQLLVRYVDSHPVVQDLRREMAEVKRFLEQHKRDQAGRVTTGRNDNYVKLEFDRLALGAEQQSLRSRSAITAGQLEQIRRQIQKTGLQQRELRELEREISLHEQNYKLYRVKAEEERATAALDEERRTNVRIIQSPVTSALPAGVPKFVKVLLAGVLGAIFGCAIVLFLEGRRRVFYSADAVETRLRLPVVLALPDLRGSRV
jgi:uncharacterized protein involved in exopolysaccharide biosynthesis